MVITLSNDGLDAGHVVASLSCDDPEVIIEQGSCDFGSILEGESKDNSGQPFVFSVEIGSGFRHAVFAWDIVVDDRYYTRDTVTLPLGRPEILVIDDDGGTGKEQFYLPVLDSLGLLCEVIDRDDGSLVDAWRYPCLIWFTGDQVSTTITEGDQDTLATYLDGGGKLFVTGQGIGNDIGGTAFFSDYLHAQDLGDTTARYIEGIEGDPISDGHSILVTNHRAAQSLAGENGGRVIYKHESGSGAAVAYEGDYRVVFFGFCYDGIATAPGYTTREEVMDRIMRWFGLTGVEEEVPLGPLKGGEYQLGSVYPNPARTFCRISYATPEAGSVKMGIYNVCGQRVRNLSSTAHAPGWHSVRWDGCDDRGMPAASGTYFVRLENHSRAATAKLLWLR
jgi:hypothetical protein